MERIKLAICMEEGEYLKRLSACFMKYYRTYLEMHIFTGIDQITQLIPEAYQVFLVGDFSLEDESLTHIPKDKVLYLSDTAEQKEEALFKSISRYEEVPCIIDALGVMAGNKENVLASGARTVSVCRLYGVYSLNAAELQLPFVIMFANILSESRRVLVVDLQENSGLSQLCETEQTGGMEDVMAMAESKKFTKARLIAAIRHFSQWDYIYPVRNSECLCEADYLLYKSMLQMIETELNYDVIILNLGVRFQGFFRLVSECKDCFLLGQGNKKGWREKAFYEELEKREKEIATDKFVRMEMPMSPSIAFSAERLADQWLWNESGDLLRKMLGRMSSCG